MSGKVTSVAILERIYEYVAQNPGCCQGHIAQALDLDVRNLNGRLASMETVDLRLCEDGQRRLFPHSRRGVLSDWFMENMT